MKLLLLWWLLLLWLMLWLVLEVLVIAVVVLTSFPCSRFWFLLSSPAVTLLLCISPFIIAMILVQDHSC